MKRLLPALILALAVHAIILSTDFSWLMLAPQTAPASKSLSITLSADQLQERKTRAAIPNNAPQKQREDARNQKTPKDPTAMPTPAPIETSTQQQKPLKAEAATSRAQKARLKKNLKALTRKKPPIKTPEAIGSVSIAKRHVAPEAPAKIFSPSISDTKTSRPMLHSDTPLIKKTHRVVPSATLESTTTAAKIDDTLSGADIKIARPLYKQNTSPPYPPKARRMGYEGIVMLKVLINESGRVNNLEVLKSSGYDILDRAALSAVKKWLFEPGTEAGIKKKMWVKIPIRFQLK